MQTNDEYEALTDIQAPGTMVFAYRTGDGVPASAVDNWELRVGEQVRPRNTGVIPRPADDADRRAWEAYAIGQGMATEDAQAASLEDLRAAYPETDDEPEVRDLPSPTDRPADGDVKADWVRWAVASGADETWATDKGTTKAELMDWTPPDRSDRGPDPEVGDPVALSATQQANG